MLQWFSSYWHSGNKGQWSLRGKKQKASPRFAFLHERISRVQHREGAWWTPWNEKTLLRVWEPMVARVPKLESCRRVLFRENFRNGGVLISPCMRANYPRLGNLLQGLEMTVLGVWTNILVQRWRNCSRRKQKRTLLWPCFKQKFLRYDTRSTTYIKTNGQIRLHQN